LDAEVISVGDELTSGQRLNTNCQWISQRLGDLGVRTIRHTTVGDDLAANIEAFRSAASRARYVIITGGLGPTLDDLTRDAMSEAFECPLELDHASLDHILNLFARRKRPMPERNRVQAMLPNGSLVVPNPHGSAPGIDMTVISSNGRPSRLFALPGVPAEMYQMWDETVAPRIENELGAVGKMRFHTVKVYGIGESDVEVHLPTLIARTRVPTVGITVSKATITLRIAGRTQTESEFQDLIAPTLAEIQAALGNLIFGEGEDELQHAVLRGLSKRQTTLGCLEVGSASLAGDWMLAAGSEAKKLFAGSIAFPTIEAACRTMIPTTGGFDAYSASDTGLQQTFGELAVQTRARFGCDLGLAFGVYPSESEMSERGQTFDIVYALATRDGLLLESRSIAGHPEVIIARIAKTALDIVRLKLNAIDARS
jgi:nicotinamide-nucleotide amidase